MANLKEMARWEQSIYQIDLLDPVLGGENGITNLPLLQLANRTLYLKKQAEYTQALVTPKSITANSANAVDAAGHSHEIALASTTTAGIVQLNDSLTSNANDQALTAKQGKKLNTEKLAKSGDTMTGALQMPTSATSLATSTPFAISHRRVQSYSNIYINANTDNNSSDEPVIITSGKGISSNKADGLAVGSNYLHWLGVSVATVNSNVASATKLHTARTINGVAFDGTANITINDNTKANKTTQFTAGAGLIGGGDLSASRSLSLGTPSKITANSTNTAVSNTHSHEIDKASTTTAGIVQLVDNLTSNANNQALTAKQGKVLNDTKLGNAGTQTLNGTLKITSNQWGKFNLPLQDGTQWWIEANPNYKTATNGQAVLRFLHMDGSARCYYDLVKSGNNEVIAYQSWVQQGFVSKTTAETITGKKTFTDEIVSTSGGNALRLKNNHTNQSVFFRFDGNHLYLMKTAAGDGDGTWDNTRPLVWNVATDSLSIKGNLNGNATTATKLHTPRNIAMTGDGSWNVNFDGTNNVSATLTLADTGVRAGSYNSVTVDAKGRVIAGLTQAHGLITATSATGTTNTATNNGNTFLNIVASGVGQTASVGSSTQITGTNGISVSSDTAGKLIISQTIANNLTDTSGNKPLSAKMGKVLDGTKLGNSGTQHLDGILWLGQSDTWQKITFKDTRTNANRSVDLEINPSYFLDSNTTVSSTEIKFRFNDATRSGNTARYITFPSINNVNQNVAYHSWVQHGFLAKTANAVSASKLHTSRTINGVAFDGTANITISDNTKVGKSGNETITGVKTFSSSPKAPTPPANSNDTTVATTAFVRTAITSNTAVLTGTIAHGGTLPLPAGFSETQCKFMVSANKDNPNRSGWDINESGSHFHYGFECWLDGRTVHVGALRGHYGHATFTPGMANYMVVGIK